MAKKAILILLLLVAGASAYEVDNFTERYSALKDSREQMNLETNSRLAEAARKANKKSNGSCRAQDLISAVNNHMGAVIVGSLETYADESIKIDKHPATKNHIYSHRTAWEKIKGFNVMTLAGLNSSVNLNGNYIGVDKFGHFFDQGYSMYKVFKEKSDYNEGVLAALKDSIDGEEGIWGYGPTGIKSHGDLAANYGGFLFWIQLTDGANPYFRCADGKWTQIRNFDWADYVLSSWDEAINCSEYSDANLAESVNRASQELEFKFKKSRGKNYKFVCPVEPNECAKMNKLYGSKAKYILSPECLAIKTESPENQTVIAQRPSGFSGGDETKPKKRQKTRRGKGKQ